MNILIPFLFLHSLLGQFCFEPKRKNCPGNYLKNSTENEVGPKGKFYFLKQDFENFTKAGSFDRNTCWTIFAGGRVFGSFCNN